MFHAPEGQVPYFMIFMVEKYIFPLITIPSIVTNHCDTKSTKCGENLSAGNTGGCYGISSRHYNRRKYIIYYCLPHGQYTAVILSAATQLSTITTHYMHC